MSHVHVTHFQEEVGNLKEEVFRKWNYQRRSFSGFLLCHLNETKLSHFMRERWLLFNHHPICSVSMWCGDMVMIYASSLGPFTAAAVVSEVSCTFGYMTRWRWLSAWRQLLMVLLKVRAPINQCSSDSSQKFMFICRAAAAELVHILLLYLSILLGGQSKVHVHISA